MNKLTLGSAGDGGGLLNTTQRCVVNGESILSASSHLCS